MKKDLLCNRKTESLVLYNKGLLLNKRHVGEFVVLLITNNPELPGCLSRNKFIVDLPDIF